MAEARPALFGQFGLTPSSEVEDMRMMSSAALAVTATAFLAACSDSPE